MACQKQEVYPEAENLPGKPLSAEEFKDFKDRVKSNSALMNWISSYTDFSRQRVQVLSKLSEQDFKQLLADVQNAADSEKQNLFYSRLNLQEKQIEFQANAKGSYLKISAENRKIMRNLTEEQFTELFTQIKNEMRNSGRAEYEAPTCYTTQGRCNCLGGCELSYTVDLILFRDSGESFVRYIGCLGGC